MGEMEILLFITTRPVLATWWARAAIIAVAASAVLNLSPRLPWLRDIKPTRIWARWTGYAGLTAALAVWTALTGRGWIEFSAWVIIALATLLPNTLVHLRAESMDDPKGDNNKVRGKLPNIIILPLESCEDILDSLTQPRRDLTVALEAIVQAMFQVKKVAALAPDQLGAQVWCQKVGDPLDAAERLVKGSRDGLEDTHQRVVAFWQVADELRKMWRQGRLAYSRK